MQELVAITTDEQGSPVVSARELHAALGVKKHFADWIKHRIAKCRLTENQDFVTVSLNGENGGRSIEYALTVDAAKHLAMIEGNEKGHEIRQYFIEAEKALRQVVAAPPVALQTEQVLIQLVAQSNQLLANQQEQLSQLRADMDSIMRGQRPTQPRKQIVRPTPHVVGPPKGSNPGNGLRQAINRKVIEYCGYHGAEQGATYNYLYRRMNEVYVINVYRLIRVGGESLLDALERYGHLDKLYSLIMAELTYVEE